MVKYVQQTIHRIGIPPPTAQSMKEKGIVTVSLNEYKLAY